MVFQSLESDKYKILKITLPNKIALETKHLPKINDHGFMKPDIYILPNKKKEKLHNDGVQNIKK